MLSMIFVVSLFIFAPTDKLSTEIDEPIKSLTSPTKFELMLLILLLLGILTLFDPLICPNKFET